MAETQPSYEQALCYTATDDRVLLQNKVLSEGVAYPGGVPYAGNLAVLTGASGLNLFVNQGGGFVNSDVDDQGIYGIYNDAQKTLTATGAASPAPGSVLDGVPNADGTNPRVDQVIALVRDSQISGVSDDWEIQVLAGTPHASAALTPAGIAASAFALPDRAIRLAYVLVPVSPFAGPFVNATHILDNRTSAHHPTIRVFRTSAWSTAAAAAEADLVFDTLSYDTFGGGTIGASGTLFNTTTGIFTAPSAGMYRVSWGVRITATDGDSFLCHLYNNGAATDIVLIHAGASSGLTNTASLVTRVTTAGHQLKLRTSTTASCTGGTGTTLTFMTIEKID